LLERAGALEPILARHGLALDTDALRDEHKTLAHLRPARRKNLRQRTLGRTASQLDRALRDLDGLLELAKKPA
jgi:hypothetical protein